MGLLTFFPVLGYLARKGIQYVEADTAAISTPSLGRSSSLSTPFRPLPISPFSQTLNDLWRCMPTAQQAGWPHGPWAQHLPVLAQCLLFLLPWCFRHALCHIHTAGISLVYDQALSQGQKDKCLLIPWRPPSTPNPLCRCITTQGLG